LCYRVLKKVTNIFPEDRNILCSMLIGKKEESAKTESRNREDVQSTANCCKGGTNPMELSITQEATR
jgi:hypothetical protein